MHLLLLLIVLAPLFLAMRVLRAIARPYRYARRAGRFGSRWGGFGGGYGNGYGRRRGSFAPGLMSILALVALERFFDHRR